MMFSQMFAQKFQEYHYQGGSEMPWKEQIIWLAKIMDFCFDSLAHYEYR